MQLNILILPGDGIGAGNNEAVKVLNRIAQKYNHQFALSEGLLGGIAIHKTGAAPAGSYRPGGESGRHFDGRSGARSSTRRHLRSVPNAGCWASERCSVSMQTYARSVPTKHYWILRR